ncbi:hypothetical protein HGRIS_002804 [Hohenbuehelia grisea]
MTRVNITVDNTSPLIAYLPWGAWIDGNSSQDKDAPKYSDGGTFTGTSKIGASAKITFRGTGIWIFGAMRCNHGLYNVSVDGGPVATGSGFADNERFQVPLFSAQNLDFRTHDIIVTNSPLTSQEPFVDIDFLVIETETFTANAAIVQDTDAAFKYTPADAWATSKLDNATSFLHSSGHITRQAGATVSFGFMGDKVEVYGTTGPDNGPYQVQLDNGPVMVFNATREAFHGGVLLYQTSGLDAGPHVLRLENLPSASNPTSLLAIDHAIINSLTNSEGQQEESSPVSPRTPGITLFIGFVVAISVLVLILLLLLLLFLIRRRRTRRSKAIPSITIQPSSQPSSSDYEAGAYRPGSQIARQWSHAGASHGTAELTPISICTPSSWSFRRYYGIWADSRVPTSDGLQGERRQSCASLPIPQRTSPGML